MKLTGLKIENFQGLRALDLGMNSPVLFVAGANHAGKSSLVEAIRCAFNGTGERVQLKKDLAALVTDGAKKARISVFIDGEPIAGLTLPAGEHIENLPPEVTLPRLAAVLDAQRFASMTADERRTLLFDVTGCKPTPAKVAERLRAKGLDQARVDTVLPMLRAGFPAAAKDAADRAREAKGAWRAVTGETYGSNKADGWKADAPPVDETLVQTLQSGIAELYNDLAAAQQNLGTLRAMQQAYQQHEARHADLVEKAGKVERIKTKLATDEAELAAWNEKVTNAQAAAAAPEVCNCPACDALLEIKDGALLLAGEQQADPALAAQLSEYTRARDTYARAVDNDRRDLAEAEGAAALLAQEAPQQVDDAGVAVQQRKCTDLAQEHRTMQEQLATLRQRLAEARSAQQRTEQAAQHHADVQAWALAAEALAPDGIPAELLADAMAPVNKLIDELSTDTGWKTVRVEQDMTISAAGRSYALLSESEKWRCDAVIALALANLSGIRFAMLDRFDVLDLPGRGQLIGLLDYMADEGLIDSVVLAGTLKALPSGLSENFGCIWLENGQVANSPETKAA